MRVPYRSLRRQSQELHRSHNFLNVDRPALVDVENVETLLKLEDLFRSEIGLLEQSARTHPAHHR